MTQNEGLPYLQASMAFMCTTMDMVATTRRTIKAEKTGTQIHHGCYYTYVDNKTTVCNLAILETSATYCISNFWKRDECKVTRRRQGSPLIQGRLKIPSYVAQTRDLMLEKI